jgi:hypothetical protein
MSEGRGTGLARSTSHHEPRRAEHDMSAAEPTAREPLGAFVVPTDFSKGAELALQRTLLLPLAPRARIHLVHVLPADLPARLRTKAESEARARLEQTLLHARKRKAATWPSASSAQTRNASTSFTLSTFRSRALLRRATRRGKRASCVVSTKTQP